MKSSLLLSALALALTLSAPCEAQTAKRAAFGLGKSLSDLADKYIEQELALERIRAQGEIEAAQRQAANQEQRRAAVPIDHVDQQIVVLNRVFPSWDKVVFSMAFKSWIEARPQAYQAMCKSTKEAKVMLTCLGDFLDTRILTSSSANADQAPP